MVHTKIADTQTYLLFLAVMIQVVGVVMQIPTLFFVGSVTLIVSLILVAFNAFYAFNFKMKENSK
ncbi:MAG: hypothetical protein LRY68_10975 [Sulfurospirillum sp.]|nr:hypothetical protein [Sulfurospirillum sp.]